MKSQCDVSDRKIQIFRDCLRRPDKASPTATFENDLINTFLFKGC